MLGNMIDITGKERDRIGWYSTVSSEGKGPNPALTEIRACCSGAKGEASSKPYALAGA